MYWTPCSCCFPLIQMTALELILPPHYSYLQTSYIITCPHLASHRVPCVIRSPLKGHFWPFLCHHIAAVTWLTPPGSVHCQEASQHGFLCFLSLFSLLFFAPFYTYSADVLLLFTIVVYSISVLSLFILLSSCFGHSHLSLCVSLSLFLSLTCVPFLDASFCPTFCLFTDGCFCFFHLFCHQVWTTLLDLPDCLNWIRSFYAGVYCFQEGNLPVGDVRFHNLNGWLLVQGYHILWILHRLIKQTHNPALTWLEFDVLGVLLDCRIYNG